MHKEVPATPEQAARVRGLLPQLASVGQPDTVFGHLRVRLAGGRVRDLFLGPRTAVGAVTVLDWQTSPLAAVFFAHDEGDDFEIEVDGRELTGEVLQRDLLYFADGALQAVGVTGQRLRRVGDAVLQDLAPALLTPRPAAQRHASPVEVPLDAAQSAAVALPAGRPVLLLGEAGCGKTTVALHRLAALCRARPQRAAVIVPTEGLRRFTRELLDRLGADRAEVLLYDRFAAAQARKVFRDLPEREAQDTTAATLRLKRHPALSTALAALAARRRKHEEGKAGARRRDLLFLFGDRKQMARVAAAAEANGRPIPAQALIDIDVHTRVQFSKTSEQEFAGVDAERLEAVDLRPLDDGTPMEDAGTIDVEDYAVLFELDRLRAEREGRAPSRPPAYDCLVVDEAQELAPLELRLIGRSLAPGGTLIVAGDDGQQVDETAYFDGWQSTLTELGAPTLQATTLAVSYRNPPAVTTVARHVLPRTGQAAPAYLDPRDLDPGVVTLRRYANECHLVAELCEALRALRSQDPTATSAVICRTARAAQRLHGLLGLGADCHLALGGDFRPARLGQPALCHVTAVEEVKGLEFDYVIVPDASAAVYPDQPAARRALYVAVTRAVQQLLLLSVGTPSPLVV